MAIAKIKVDFTCYRTFVTEGEVTFYVFYPYRRWDECKHTLKDALAKYPLDTYEWIHFEDNEEAWEWQSQTATQEVTQEG